MTKEFIPYEQALALKELGFDEKCFGWYSQSKEKVTCHIHFSHNKDYNTRTRPWTTDEFDCCTAPLYQQVFKFFREKYNLYHDIFVDDGKTFGFMISYFTTEGRIDKPIQRDYVNYEEAEQACLEKLIEIVKNK